MTIEKLQGDADDQARSDIDHECAVGKVICG